MNEKTNVDMIDIDHATPLLCAVNYVGYKTEKVKLSKNHEIRQSDFWTRFNRLMEEGRDLLGDIFDSNEPAAQTELNDLIETAWEDENDHEYLKF